MESNIAALRALTAEEQKQVEQWTTESRALERQAQAATTNRNTAEATRLRAVSADLAGKVRALRSAHQERVATEITDLMAQYELTNLKPGTAENAISVKPDPNFPNYADPNRIQMITILFSETPDPRAVTERAWQKNTKETFDFAALEALLK